MNVTIAGPGSLQAAGSSFDGIDVASTNTLIFGGGEVTARGFWGLGASGFAAPTQWRDPANVIIAGGSLIAQSESRTIDTTGGAQVHFFNGALRATSGNSQGVGANDRQTGSPWFVNHTRSFRWQTGMDSTTPVMQFPPNQLVIPDGSGFSTTTPRFFAVTSQTMPVYRLFNAQQSAHFWTGSVVEYENLDRLPGWSGEWIAWWAPNSGLPVNRLFDSQNNAHVWSGNATEIADLVSRGWTNEGTTFFSAPLSGFQGRQAAPVHRLENPRPAGTQRHLLSMAPAEISELVGRGWIDEGPAFFALQ